MRAAEVPLQRQRPRRVAVGIAGRQATVHHRQAGAIGAALHADHIPEISQADHFARQLPQRALSIPSAAAAGKGDVRRDDDPLPAHTPGRERRNAGASRPVRQDVGEIGRRSGGKRIGAAGHAEGQAGAGHNPPQKCLQRGAKRAPVPVLLLVLEPLIDGKATGTLVRHAAGGDLRRQTAQAHRVA